MSSRHPDMDRILRYMEAERAFLDSIDLLINLRLKWDTEAKMEAVRLIDVIVSKRNEYLLTLKP